jgi:uncharacterized membrane protein HdeD (DUF308 family)
MFDQLISRWWIIATRGVVAVAFGVAAVLAPEKALMWLVSLFGIFAIADGIFTMGAGLSLNWLSLFLQGVVGGAVGILTFAYPPAAHVLFGILVVAWAVATGTLEVAGAVRLRQIVKDRLVTGEWLLAASGLLTLLFAAVFAVQTDARAATFTLLLGGYAIASGVLLLSLGLNIRSWRGLLPVAG